MTALMAFLGAIIGALVSGVFLESYKRHRDRQGVASALAGEIFALMQMSARRNYVQWFTIMLAQLDSGTDVVIPAVIQTPVKMEPVIEAHIDRIGSLGGNYPERIATFYHYVQGIKIDLVNLAAGRFDGDVGRKANLIREDLGLWHETLHLGNDLLRELHLIEQEQHPITKVAGFLNLKRLKAVIRK